MLGPEPWIAFFGQVIIFSGLTECGLHRETNKPGKQNAFREDFCGGEDKTRNLRREKVLLENPGGTRGLAGGDCCSE